VDRFGIHQLHQRIAHIGLRGKGGMANESGSIDRICDGGVNIVKA
jgi:hypothetical protein